LLLYHDRNPKDNYEQKVAGIKAQGATQIMRFDDKVISDFLYSKYGVRSNWLYGTAPSTGDRISSAFSYLRFENNKWTINIQDVWTIPNPPSQYYINQFQDGCYQRVSDVA
jgi:hypothetical protein